MSSVFKDAEVTDKEKIQYPLDNGKQKAEDKLRETELLYRTVFRQSPDGILIIDTNGNFIEFNEAAHRQLGYSREEFEKLRLSDIDAFEGPEEVLASIDDVLEKGSAEFEVRHRTKEGEIRDVRVTTQLVVLSGRSFFHTIWRDITERKRAEEERARLVSAIEAAADAIVMTDSRGMIKYVNPAVERITGYTKDETLGRDLHILDSGKHDESFYRELRETLKRRGVWTGRLVNKKKDGTLYQEECTCTPVKNQSGEIINYVSIKRDVTEKIKLESVAQAVDTMNNIGYIFSGVRHEIGNPVNNIEMILESLRLKLEKIEKPAIRNYIDRSLHEVAKVEYLLRSLKNFNLYEKLDLQNIRLPDFMEKFLALVSEDFKAKGIGITVSVDPEADLCYADSRALHQVLLNILTNASDALEGRENPSVAISVSKKYNRIHIRVADNGCGMEEDRQKDLFKPFYTTKARGTGLGLVIAKKMLAMMNGDIEITSHKDVGTTVDIDVPEGRTEEHNDKS